MRIVGDKDYRYTTIEKQRGKDGGDRKENRDGDREKNK